MSDLTDRERIKKLSKEEKSRAAFAGMKDIISTVDLTSTRSITYTTYSKDNLRTYLRNPALETNQKNLRNLSNYLYTVSHVYRRLINFKAMQMTLKSWVAYPVVPMNEEPDAEKIMSDYEHVCKYVTTMNMKSQILKCNMQAWLNDVVYGFCYGDPDDDTFFIHLLDPDYCIISSQHWANGVLGFAFDFSFFNGANRYYLDVYDPIFKKMYNKYQHDTSLRWQQLPIERTFCYKINSQNIDYPVPPLSGLFDSLIDLVDLQNIQNIKDELEAYKLIYAKIDTISGSKQVDDFEIDLELAGNFYQKIANNMPDNILFALSPMELKSLDFVSNTANDTNIISDAYQNIIDANGGIVLNHNRITNSTAFKLALMFDTMDALAPVQQINAWINLFIKNNLGETSIVVEFDDTSPFFIEDKISSLTKMATYGMPVKMKLMSMIGAGPTQTSGMEFIEQQLGLGVSSWIHPLISSNTQSGIPDAGDGSEGRPPLDETELSDSGIETRDADKNLN